MENEIRELTIKEHLSLLVEWLSPWLFASFDDGERLDCQGEIVIECGVWLSGPYVNGGSSVNVGSSLTLGIGGKGCTPSMNCGPRE